MSRAASGGGGGGGEQRRCSIRYRGVRRRRWGKWVSEIRVPGTRERLWLGSYAAPEAAAVAHDAAACLLRGERLVLNFPDRAAGYAYARHQQPPLSPRSVQRVASDAGMAADAQMLEARERSRSSSSAPERGGAGKRWWPYARPTYVHASGAACTNWCTAATPADGGNGSKSSSDGTASEHQHQLTYGDISVDDMEILM